MLWKAVRFVARHPWSVGLSALSGACFIALADEVRDGELNRFDAAVADLVTRGRGTFDGPMLALTHLGDGLNMTLISLGAVAACALRRRYYSAAYIAIASGGAALLNGGLKLFFQRTRPEDLLYLIETPSSYSFPSGHAMGAAGVLGCIIIELHALGIPRVHRVGATLVGSVLIVGIGLSRIYLGVHFASDVLGGQLAAAAWVSAVTGWFYPRLLPGEEATPEATAALTEVLPEAQSGDEAEPGGAAPPGGAQPGDGQRASAAPDDSSRDARPRSVPAAGSTAKGDAPRLSEKAIERG